MTYNNYSRIEIDVGSIADIMIANDLINIYNVIPLVKGNIEPFLDILDYRAEIIIDNSILDNPLVLKFNVIIPTDMMSIRDILDCNKKLLGKVHNVLFDSDIASDFMKMGYVPGVYFIPGAEFAFDVDMYGMKIWHMCLTSCNDENAAKFLEQVEEFDEIQILAEHIHMIKPHMKIKKVFIQNTYTDNAGPYDAQSIADNPNIVDIECLFELTADFTDNYTLLKACTKDKYIVNIAIRNAELKYKSRFTKAKLAE